jgi:hypothetical protein
LHFSIFAFFRFFHFSILIKITLFIISIYTTIVKSSFSIQ